MAEEEPMELSGEGSKIIPGFNDSESDMVIDSPIQMSTGGYKFHYPEVKMEYDWFSASVPSTDTNKVVNFAFKSYKERRSLCNIKFHEQISKHCETTVSSPMRRLSEPLHQIKDFPKHKPVGDKPRKKRKLDTENKDKTSKQPKNKWLCKCIAIIICVIAVSVTFVVNSDKNCDINIDSNYLKKSFNEVYGQHIAINTLLPLFQDFSRENRIYSSPLVLSFHGWTGVGKNYVTRIITDSFTRKKFNLFLIPLHFADESKQGVYKRLIPEWIKGNISTCVMNIFVFDEMDKASEGVLAGLHTALFELKHQNNSDTQILFILLSNSKARKINDHLFSKLSHGRSRTSLQINEFMSLLLKDAEQEWYVDLYKDQLVDLFIPFLPLNDEHVINCIKKDLANKGRQHTPSIIEAVKKDLLYFRSTSGEQYSLTGCKRVSDKVDFHLLD